MQLLGTKIEMQLPRQHASLFPECFAGYAGIFQQDFKGEG